jgi:hypothetical protein
VRWYCTASHSGCGQSILEFGDGGRDRHAFGQSIPSNVVELVLIGDPGSAAQIGVRSASSYRNEHCSDEKQHVDV